MKIDLLLSFSVTKEELPTESIDKVEDILVANEDILYAFSHIRDKIWFTSKRIIALDIQGITGNKKEYRSFAYDKINSFSIETAGAFDGDSDFKIWVSSVGVFEIKFKKSLDIKKIGKLLSQKTLA